MYERDIIIILSSSSGVCGAALSALLASAADPDSSPVGVEF